MGDAVDGVIAATEPQAAHHEAGHAVAAAALGVTVNSIRIWNGTLPGRGLPPEWLGVTHTPDVAPVVDAIITLAGGAGEARYDGTPGTHPESCEWEWAQVHHTLVELVGVDRAGELQDRLWNAASQLVALNQSVWRSVAEALLADPSPHLDAEVCARLLAPVVPTPVAALVEAFPAS